MMNETHEAAYKAGKAAARAALRAKGGGRGPEHAAKRAAYTGIAAEEFAAGFNDFMDQHEDQENE